jgi:hypothetical protein
MDLFALIGSTSLFRGKVAKVSRGRLGSVYGEERARYWRQIIAKRWGDAEDCRLAVYDEGKG